MIQKWIFPFLINYKIIFLFTIILGTILTFISNNWWMAWLGMELNLLGFISFTSKYYNNESIFKYFIVQSLSSIVLLRRFISIDMNYFFFNRLILIALILKLGASPLHFWLPLVVEYLNNIQLLIVLTWQKIAPLILIIRLPFNKIVFVRLIFRLLVGSIGNINELRVFTLYTYSSIRHTGWIILSSIINENICILYLLVYRLILITVVLSVNKKFIRDHWYKLNILYFINLLSLGGLPPFTGFFIKWVIIKELINFRSLLILRILIFTSILLIYIYLRLTFISYMQTNFKKLFNINNKHYILTILISILNLPFLIVAF